MKTFLILSFIMLLNFGCKNFNNQVDTDSDFHTLHFNLITSQATEPISLLYFQGFYHLFYFNSDKSSIKKVNFIGHVTSKNLTSWTEETRSKFSKKNNLIYRGGIIIDSNNITGYGTIENPPLIALYTVSEKEGAKSDKLAETHPMLAYSNDGGDSWIISTNKNNLPVALLKNPQNINLFYYPSTFQWIMSIVLPSSVEFYSSSDLNLWNFESSFNLDFLSGDLDFNRSSLFPLSDEIHWALLINFKSNGTGQNTGGTLYLIGSFDGHNFTNQSSKPQLLDYGKNVYGSIVTVGNDNRRLNIVCKVVDTGGMRTKDSNEINMVTIPRELWLDNLLGEYILVSSPVSELNDISREFIELKLTNVSSIGEKLPVISDIRTPFEVFLRFNTSEIKRWNFPSKFGLQLWNEKGEYLSFGYDSSFRYYFIDRSGLTLYDHGTGDTNSPLIMPFTHSDSTLSFHLVIDGSTVEFYTEDGKLVMTESYHTQKQFNKAILFAENGKLDLLEGKIINYRTTKF